jgi:putative inorganic carbon (hco3(-)) transporter
MAHPGATISTPGIWQEGRPALSRPRGLVDDVAVFAFFFIFYANLAVVASRLHGVPNVIASGVVLLLAIPLARHLVLERQPLVVTPVVPLVFAFLGALFLAAVLSKDPGVSSAPLYTYLTEGLVLFLLVTNAVRATSMLTKVVWALILAGAFMGAVSVIQELTHTYANDYGGLAQVDRLGTGGGFNIAPQDAAEKTLRPRLGGPLGSENRYAQILAAVLPLALLQAFRARKRGLRLVATGCSLLILGGLLLTFSRGAAVAVAATLVFMAVLRELPIRQLLAALAVLTLLVFLVVPDYVTRLRSLEGVTSLSSSDSSQLPDSSIIGRKAENLAAWQTFLDHPIIGVGPGVYFQEYSRQNANRLGLKYLESERRGHSLYLELAADSGLIGVGAFLAMVGTAFVFLHRSARRWRKRDPDRALLASSFFFGLFAYLACGIFMHLSYQRYFWMLLALASSTIWALRHDAEDELARPGPTSRAPA